MKLEIMLYFTGTSEDEKMKDEEVCAIDICRVDKQKALNPKPYIRVRTRLVANQSSPQKIPSAQNCLMSTSTKSTST